jgi:hypothetical protein
MRLPWGCSIGQSAQDKKAGLIKKPCLYCPEQLFGLIQGHLSSVEPSPKISVESSEL